MISNSVTHLQSYTNTAIVRNSAPISPVTPRRASTSPHRAPTTPHRAPILSHRMMSAPVFHAGLEFLFQEQSYSSLHSGRSLACDHFRGDIDDHCGVIADFCGVIADFCGVIADFCGVIDDPCGVGAIPEAIGAPARSPIVARLAKHHKTLLNIIKHHETCKT